MLAAFFGLFAGIAFFSALAVAWQKNLLYATFYLLSCFMGIAAIYLLLGAEFLAVTQILIYVGGILTLFLFGILITKRRELRYLTSGIQRAKTGIVIAIALFGILIYSTLRDPLLHTSSTAVPASTKLIGLGLLTNYLIPFELVGVVLLVILIGSLALYSHSKTE